MLDRFPSGRTNPEYRVACYVIAHPEIFKKATRQAWEFPFEDWRDTEDFSRGIRLLIDAGFHLYNGGRTEFNLMEGLAVWDTGNYSVFIQACEIRKGWA